MDDKVLTCTPQAMELLGEQLNGDVLVVRAAVEDGQYVYDLEGVAADQVEDRVEVVYEKPVRIVVAHDSRRHLYGAEIGVRDGGLSIKNPNRPAPVRDETLCNDDETAEQVARLLGLYINPDLGQHGGRAWMIGHEDRRAHIVLGGGCSGCSMANDTMFGGIERIIVARVEGIDAVVDDTAHETGDRPYYRGIVDRAGTYR